ncbi:MAG: tyrosine-type recombinase/integrase [Ruminiclostridium sp.]
MSKQRNPNGMGSYKKRKDGRISWTQKKDGKPRVLYARNLTELIKKVKKVADLPITDSNKLTVDDWFTKWLEIYIKPLKKQATYDQYRTLYEQHVKPILGHRKLPGVTSLDIQTVIAKMNEKVVKKAKLDEKGKIIIPEKKGYSTKTMKETKGVINRAFSKAVKDKLISENPVKDIELPNKQKKPKKVLSVQELHDLFKAMEHSRWIWAMRLLLVTGLRRGELLALRDTDIDIDNRRIIIDESNSSTGLGDTKSAQIHYVPLSKKALQYLSEQGQMLVQENNPIVLKDDLKKTGLLFPSENGTMLRADSFTKLVGRFATKAEIKASPHCFRHTFVFLNRKVLSLKELQYILGHDESTTTTDLYGDMIEDSAEELANAIDNVFDKIDDKLSEIDEKNNKKQSGKGKVIEFKRKTS